MTMIKTIIHLRSCSTRCKMRSTPARFGGSTRSIRRTYYRVTCSPSGVILGRGAKARAPYGLPGTLVVIFESRFKI